MKKRIKNLIGVLVTAMLLITGNVVFAAQKSAQPDGGPVKVVYDKVGNYVLNYTGNTNAYEFWNDSGDSKIVSNTYRDRTDISASVNSTAALAASDSKSKIKEAYLIWETRSAKGAVQPIHFYSPKSGKTKFDITPQGVCKDTRTSSFGRKYTGQYTMFADVTSIVTGQYGGYGTYTVANIPVWNGVSEDNAPCGGESVASWQLVVIEESPNFPLRNISLNIMSQYYKNTTFTVKVDLSTASKPNGQISAQFLDGIVDVKSKEVYDGIGYPDDYKYKFDGRLYRYLTPTRGLYKNGRCINDRGQDYSDKKTDINYKPDGSYTFHYIPNGGVRAHLFDDKRRENGENTSYTTYYWNDGAVNVFMQGIALDTFAYHIVFDGNGADRGKMEKILCLHGRDYTLSANQFSRDHYKFMGWNTRPDGSGMIYDDKQSIINLTDTEKEVVLYAQWKPDAYEISLDECGAAKSGTLAYYEWYGKGNYAEETLKTPLQRILIPEKPGNTFGGYYTMENGAGRQYIDEVGTILSTPTTFVKNTTLYAKWIPKVYKITLDSQNAETAGTKEYYEKFNVGNYTTAACVTSIRKIAKPSKKHYAFQGYFTEKEGEGQRIIDEAGNIVPAYALFLEDTTLYAHWKPETYTITLDNQNATNTGSKAYYEEYGVCNYIQKNTAASSLGTATQIFDYNGSVQYFIAPADGTYTLKLWGAAGGYKYSAEDAGKGGYTTGKIALKEGDILYFYVGGQGSSTSGGWNGGGNPVNRHVVENMNGWKWVDGRLISIRYDMDLGYHSIYGGGGATDVRKNGTGLDNRIIVAGGGGGAANNTFSSKVLIYFLGGKDADYELRGGYGGGDAAGVLGLPQITVHHSKAPYETGRPVTYLYAGMKTLSEIQAYVPASQTDAGHGGADNGKYVLADVTLNYVIENKGAKGNGSYGGGGGYFGGSHVGVAKESSYYQYAHNCFDLSVYEYKVFACAGNGGSSYIGGVSDGTIAKSNWRSGNGRAEITYTKYTTENRKANQIVIPKRTGYLFDGYFTGKNGTGKQYVDAGGNILSTPTTFTADTTLYAKWKAAPANPYYQVAFHGNGADSGKMSAMTCYFNRTYELPANQFQKKGCLFAGWSKTPTGSIQYANRGSITNLSSVNGDVVTLYAVWMPENADYTVNHYTANLNNSGWSLQETEKRRGAVGKSVPVADLKKSITGFTYHHAEVKGTVVTTANIQADGNLVVNLYYQRKAYVVTLEKGTGIAGVSGAGTYEYGAKVEMDATVGAGYSWSGWSGTYHTDKKEYSFTMPLKNVTMTAEANPNIYRITLDSQQAEAHGSFEYYEKYAIGNYAEHACKSEMKTIKMPERTGYTFGGYYTGRKGAGVQCIDASGRILAEPNAFTADTTLYAQWISNTYRIHFEGNGATDGFMDDVICSYTEYRRLPYNAFEKTNYSFVSWNTAADGSGINYLDGTYIEKLASETEGVVILYAQWRANQYVVHFDANGGAGKMADRSYTFDQTEKLPLHTFTKNNGYGDSTFRGWNFEPDTQEIFCTDGAEIRNLAADGAERVTLYAIWDDCPWIEADDLYYTLEQAKNGAITGEELMRHATARDREDGGPLLAGVDAEKGTQFGLIDYQESDFTQFAKEGSVTETYRVIDSAGNTYKKRITVYVVDTAATAVRPEGTTRFIDEKYYHASFENGGLEENSIWKTRPEYAKTLQRAFSNMKNDTPEQTFVFSHEEILRMKNGQAGSGIY